MGMGRSERGEWKVERSAACASVNVDVEENGTASVA